MKTIILIGDSIRMGYSPFVRRELEGVADFWEPETNGGTSRNVLANLDEWVISRAGDIVHLNCGLHDLARDPGAGGVRVQVAEYEQNLREIFSRILAAGKTLIWATTTPVHEENHRKVKTMERWEKDVEQYNALALSVAQELNVPVDDLNAVVRTAGPDRILLPDGVHFTPEGSEILGRAVAQCLRKYL